MIKLSILTATERLEARNYEVLNKRNSLATPSDFAILLGAEVSEFDFTDKPINNEDILWGRYLKNTKSIENRTGLYWTRKTPNCEHSFNMNPNDRFYGIRPITNYSNIKDTCKNERVTEDGITIVEWGEYPQQTPSKEMQETLEILFNENKLNKTNKTYTTDSRNYQAYDSNFKEQKHIEYEYNGKKYIRIKANTNYSGLEVTLSNNQKYKDNDYVWVEVQPINWAIDKEKNIAIAEKIIVAGIQYNNYGENTEDFNKTNLCFFMNNYLVKDITPKEYTQTPTLVDYNIENNNGIINLTIADMNLEDIKLINIQTQDKKEESSFSRK